MGLLNAVSPHARITLPAAAVVAILLAVPPAWATSTITPPAAPANATGTGTFADPWVVTPTAGSYSFAPQTGKSLPEGWYDPPFISGFDYTLTGLTGTDGFTSVQTKNLLPYTVQVWAGGLDVATLNPGDTFSFASGVTDFQLLGISPPFDAATTDIGAAFPVNVFWTGSPTSLVITPLSDAIPEPASLAGLAVGLAGLGVARRRRRA